MAYGNSEPQRVRDLSISVGPKHHLGDTAYGQAGGRAHALSHIMTNRRNLSQTSTCQHDTGRLDGASSWTGQ